MQVIEPEVFLDVMEQMGIGEISQLEVACLFRVLSKPELEHRIVLQELMLVMENFGVPIGGEEEDG